MIINSSSHRRNASLASTMSRVLLLRRRELLFAIAIAAAFLRYNQINDRSLQSFVMLRSQVEDGNDSIVSTVSSSYQRSHQPSTYIIDQTRKRAKHFRNMTQAIDEVKILAVDHPAFRNISKPYQPWPAWKKAHFPDVSIAGLQKAGSSQLYSILTTHSDMVPFMLEKEFPFAIPHLSMDVSKLLLQQQPQQQTSGSNVTKQGQMASLQSFFFTRNKLGKFPAAHPQRKARDVKTAASPPLLTVNGCLDTVTVLMMRQYLQRTTSSKIIFVVRDPADWLWASYNFWTYSKHHDLLKAAQKTDWAALPEQYRSPELFHELLLAGSDRFGPTAELIGKLRDRISNLFTRVVAAAHREDPDRVLVVKTEDMAPDRIESSGFLKRLADFLDVSLDGFDASVFRSFSNCGNSRGIGEKCAKASSAYAIAGNRTMLEESQDLVYLYFAEECRLWANQFGIRYERCLQVSDQYKIHSS